MSVFLGIRISAYDDASKVVTDVGRGVETLGKKTRKTGDEVAKTGKKFASFNRILETATGMIVRDLINNFSSAITESIELGGQIGTLQKSFDALTRDAGVTDLTLDKLRQATKGTVSDVDLLTMANNALALGLPIDQLESLFSAAMDVGHAMGQTTTKSVQDLTTALGRGSARILDNLGILVDTNSAYESYALTLGKTSEELTEAERKTAFQTAAMASLNDKARVLEGTTSESQLAQERWNASVENAKTSAGGFLGPLGQFAPVLKGVMPLLGSMATTLLPKLITQQNLATLATHGLTIATKLFNFILNMNPLVLIASAVALIIAAFVDWGAVIKWLQDRIEGLFGWLRDVADFFGGIFGSIKDFITGGGKPVTPRILVEEEDEAPSVIPVLTAQKGLDALIKKPTLILAGERGTERLMITPRSGASGYSHRGVNRVQMIFMAPIINVEGSMDRGLAEESAITIQQVLQNVVIEPTSPSAPTEHRRIRIGTGLTSPSTVQSSNTTLGSTLFRRGGGTRFRI
jgi:hypothetical protein